MMKIMMTAQMTIFKAAAINPSKPDADGALGLIGFVTGGQMGPPPPSAMISKRSSATTAIKITTSIARFSQKTNDRQLIFSLLWVSQID
jgi:hypothetical protein